MKYLWKILENLSPGSEFSGGMTYESIICVKGVKPSLEEVETKNAELEAAEPMRLLRAERDELIALTDWRFRSDLSPSQAWIDYCQALRNLPATASPSLDENGNLTGVTWPTPPSE
jgi:hypothetical protein